MIRNAKAGDCVIVLAIGKKDSPRTGGSHIRLNRDGCKVAHWDYAEGNTGIVTGVIRKYNLSTREYGHIQWVVVAPDGDNDNFGEIAFRPGELKRI